MGGLVRCVSCGEVHWNLRLVARADSVAKCRLCGAELRPEPPRVRRRFDRIVTDRRDAPRPGRAAGLGPSAGS